MTRKTALLAALLLLSFCHFVGADTAPPPDSMFGINGVSAIHMREQPQVWEESRKRLALLEDLGAAYDRIELWWGVVQPERDRWDFSFADKNVELYKGSKVRPLCILSYSSAWSDSPPTTDEERAAFGEYVFRLVSRYKDTIKHWEVWNEPNIPTFWNKPDAAQYAQLLRVAYKRAKEADSSCVVIAGSTSGPDAGFIRDIAKAGAWSSCDAISIHPYSMAGGPEQQRLPDILDIVQAAIAGTGQPKPLWITEIGWTENSDSERAAQAAYLAQTYVLAALGGVQKVFWFKLDDFEEKWGIYSHDGKPKPAYSAFKTLAANFQDPRHIGPLLLGPTIRANLFLCGSHTVAVAWAMDGKPAKVRVQLEPTSRVLTVLGDLVERSPDGSFEVGLTPVLVIDPAPQARNDAARSRRRRAPDLYSTNLMVNPGFEDGPADSAEAWNKGTFDSSATSGRMFIGAGREQGRSAGISKATNAAWDNWPIPVYAGQRYKLTVWCKASGTRGATQTAIHWYSGNQWKWLGSNSSEPASLDGKWQLLTAEGTAPEQAVFARIRIVANELDGEALFDDCSFVQVSSQPE